jgi:hypothetical protein
MNYSHLKNIKSYEDLHHNCDEFIELRERNKIKGTAYGFQCQFCGEFRGGEVSKKNYSEKPPWYDSELEDSYWATRKAISISLTPQMTTESTYTPTEPKDHYSALEKLINNYCDENKVNRNTIFKPLLIRQRDKYILNEFESIWDNEVQLHKWFKENFSEYFEIYSEVEGYGYLNQEKRKIRIDFIIKAKPKLIEHGFTEQYIGVEVKYLSPKEGKGFKGKSSRGVFQALSYWYSGARWLVPGKGEVELATVLMFSNFSFSEESKSLFNTMDSYYQTTWQAYLSLANHANVGELLVRTYKGKMNYWSMAYSGAKYYSMNNSGEYVKGNPNVINKKRIGNSK